MVVNGATMDEATANFLQAIRDALREVPGREVAAVRAACLVGMAHEDGRMAAVWLGGYLSAGSAETGESARGEEKHPGHVGSPVSTQVGA
jgi:hypothetical protein